MTHSDSQPGYFDPEEFPIVVAIDFGTTFSGCAYAYAPDDREARLITAWPKQDIQYAKTPTLNLYKLVDSKYKMVEWGWKSKLEMESPSASKHIQLSQYKPYLDENLSLTPWKDVVSVPDAISDYLHAFHEYAAEKILQEFGPSYSRNCFRYCLTVPAMWSDRAKDVMRRAAIKAQLITDADHPGRLLLVSEPEAAALYCERACKQYDLKHGDRFLICDAGGGTVDLIAYEIALSSQGRQLSEVTKGHGASCGSMFIDLKFRNLLIKKFGKEYHKFPKTVILKLIETFAYQLKPHFDGIEDQYLALPRSNCFDSLDNPEDIGIDDGYMCLNASELKLEVFDPVVMQVLVLIREQLASFEKCAAIFMVGGFGASSYLLGRVKQEFNGKVRTISAPYRPEVAVVCGAVYVGLSPKTVTARVSRRCYGVGVYDKFEEGVDPISLRRFRVEGVCCIDRFSVFVTKGQKIQVDECVMHRLCVIKQYSTDTGAASVRIYAIDGDPPRYTTRLQELAQISIPGPFKSSDAIGHSISLTAKMYFGLSEINAEVFIQGKKYCTTLRFENSGSYADPQLRLL
ncbi:Heat shock 70 kDa protein 12A [Linnemannia zychae]|nr:Heat shock 70 kDa protein 12A [Linnemannia zychae]